MSGEDYNGQRQEVVDRAVSLAQSPLVLFRQECKNWGPDILTAAVQHPTDVSRFLVIGNFHQFPGWKNTGAQIDWENLSSRVGRWVLAVSRLAEGQVSTDQAVVGRSGGGVSWIVWEPQENQFSNPHRVGWDGPVPVFPESAVRQYEDLCRSAHQHLCRLRENESAAHAMIQRARKWLGQVGSEINAIPKPRVRA